jgi:membrane protein YqaA with SNARE-associated domain
MFGLTGLFLAAFLAATIVPAQSEAVLVGLIVAGDHAVGALLFVATVGNVGGSLVNWILGRYLGRLFSHPRFPFSPDQIERAQRSYHKWGWVSLFASWVPIIGDPITVVAGTMKEPLWRFMTVVTIAKFGRYAVLAWVTVGLM